MSIGPSLVTAMQFASLGRGREAGFLLHVFFVFVAQSLDIGREVRSAKFHVRRSTDLVAHGVDEQATASETNRLVEAEGQRR